MKVNVQTIYNELGECRPESNVAVVVHRSWRSTWPYLLCFFLSCWFALRFAGQAEMLLPFHFSFWGTDYEVILPIFSLLGAVSLARPLFLVYDEENEIGCHHVRSTSGICSLRKKRLEYSYEDLLGVGVDQSIVDRLLGIGRISVGTAMKGIPEIVMKGVSDPQKFGKFVTDRIDHARIKAKEKA